MVLLWLMKASQRVFRAIYTVENPRIQTASLTLQAPVGGLYYLDDSEIYATTQMTQWSVMRQWNRGARGGANRLYTNNA